MGDLNVFWRGITSTAVLVFERALGWEVSVEELQHVPADEGAILAFNHHGYVDVVMLAWGPALELGRPVRFLAKAELFRHWASRWLVRGVGAVPVERGVSGDDSRAHAYVAAVEALRAGELVALAPEQTISESYDLLPFKLGAARLAIEAAVPLVPSIGWGSHRAVPKGHAIRPLRRIPVVVRYGEPVHPRPGESPEQLSDRLRVAMAALLDDVQRSYPAAPADGDDWWIPARLGGSAPAHEQVVAEHAARFARRAALRASEQERLAGGRPQTAAPDAAQERAS